MKIIILFFFSFSSSFSTGGETNRKTFIKNYSTSSRRIVGRTNIFLFSSSLSISFHAWLLIENTMKFVLFFFFLSSIEGHRHPEEVRVLARLHFLFFCLLVDFEADFGVDDFRLTKKFFLSNLLLTKKFFFIYETTFSSSLLLLQVFVSSPSNVCLI